MKQGQEVRVRGRKGEARGVRVTGRVEVKGEGGESARE